MMNFMKRSMALLLALFLCLSLLPTTPLTVNAAGYVYNWGSRGDTATELSGYATAFYTGSNTYDALSALPGGTGKNDAPNSSLYRALQNLMVSAHSYKTSYDATKELYQYTDCQNGGGKISSFYSGTPIGPSWNGTWNREHTWPNSKGLGGQDENDIMMLRPTASSENSARGNKAYGQSAGYYHPNSESGYTLDLRGDVARIFLYVYVRWGNVNGNGDYDTWGTRGVMESPEVMLQWMEEDPVDTWELGRNDSVQSITGTRNVFVDYPELAFLLFGENIPNTMTTPSGEASNAVGCEHNYVKGNTVAPTCTAEGYTVYTCTLCSKSYQGDKVPAAHKFENGICSVCGEINYDVAGTPVPGTAYKLGLYSTNKSATYYFIGTMSGYYGATETAYEKGVDVFVEETAGGYHLYFLDAGGAKQYINLVASGTYKNFTFGATASSVYTWDAAKNALKTTIGSEVCYIGTYGTYVTMGVLQTSKLKDTDYIARLYAIGGSSEPEQPDCKHINTKIEGAKDATCTENGHTGKTVCADCGATVNAGQVIAASGHSYVDGICGTCGEKAPAASEPTYVTSIAPGTAYKLGLYSTNKSATYYFTGAMSGYYGATETAYEQGVDVFVEEANGGYYLYFIDANGAKQYINLVASGTYKNFTFGATASSVYTWDAEKNALYTTVGTEVCYIGTYGTYVTMGVLQTSKLKDTDYIARLYTMAGSSEPEQPDCKHTNTKIEGAKDATCTVDGHTGKTVCVDCGATVNAGSVITATGHNYVNGTCSACGAQEPVQGETTTVTISFASTAQRTEFNASKQVWEQNGITVTNEKASSTSSVADYSNPARFYKGSSLKIEYPGMIQLEFACDSSERANALQSSITGATAVANGTKVTVTFAEPQDSLSIAQLSAQVRVKNIVITAVSTGETPDIPTCQHTNTTTQDAKDATCTENGHTGKTVCADCGETLNEGNVITAPGHSYVDGACSVCGEKAPVEGETTTATITFDDKAKRTAYSVTEQVWEENGITVTNLKAGSNTNVGDYFNPARFYASSSLKIEYPGMTKIEFACDNATYATDLKNSITGVTAAVSGTKVTVTFAEPQDSFDIAKMSKQVRVDSITVTAAPAEPACEHANTVVEGAKAATCTEDGFTGKVTCTDCGEVVDEGDVITAPGHNYVDHFCSGCGQMDPNAPKYNVYFLVPNDVAAVAPMVSDPNGITLPAAGTVEGYTFLGWVTEVVDNVTEPVNYIAAGQTYRAKQDTTLYALYSYEKTTVVEPTSGTASISFASTAQRTEFNSTKQVWAQNGITVTNLKASSSNAVADYSNPARFYASSSLKVEHSGMTQIEFTCDSSSYANALKNSISGSTASGSKVTVTFSAPQDSLDIAKLSAQVRVKSISVTYSTPGSQETVTYFTTVIGDGCTHSNTTVGQKDATCTEAGYKDALICTDCQAILVNGETVAALGHEAGAAATCETAQTCIRCDHVFVAALGHEAGAAATCETAQTCIRCDHVFVAALGHEAGAAATCETAQTCIRCDHVFAAALGHEAGAAATCETAQTCTRCNEVLVAALGHEAGAAATCETAQTCIRCDHVFVAALGHEAGAAATCESAQTCVRCDHVFAAALGHEAGAEATCETAQICTRCEKVLVAALGHKAGAKATCTSAQTCTRCDHVFEPALGHNVVKYAAKEPTCSQVGWKAYEACSRCSYSTYSEIAKKAHTNTSVVTAPTCTEEGYTTNTCSVCGNVSKSDTVAALGHKLTHVEAKDATAEAEGNIEHWSCETCQGMWTDEACTKSTTKEAIVLPKLEAPATEATTEATTEAPTNAADDTTTIGATDDKDEGSKTPVILVGGLVVLIVLALLILLGIKKFGKK